MKVRQSSARTAVGKALLPLFPAGAGWQLVEHENTVDDNNRVRVRCTVREIARSTTGYAGAHLNTVRVTVTVPTDSLASAEGALDDAMDLFLFALDAASLPWERATKGRFEDEGNRLGYQVDIETRTTIPEEEK